MSMIIEGVSTISNTCTCRPTCTIIESQYHNKDLCAHLNTSNNVLITNLNTDHAHQSCSPIMLTIVMPTIQ